jgi:hypothetical protein
MSAPTALIEILRHVEVKTVFEEFSPAAICLETAGVPRISTLNLELVSVRFDAKLEKIKPSMLPDWEASKNSLKFSVKFDTVILASSAPDKTGIFPQNGACRIEEFWLFKVSGTQFVPNFNSNWIVHAFVATKS